MDPQRVVIDTERVIAQVRAHPPIWQPKHPQYKSREARQHAWSDISRALVPALADMARSDQSETEKKIQQRWRTARDSFVKSRAQQLEGAGAGAASGRERNYGYYAAMSFLEPTLRPPLKARAASPPARGVRRRRPRPAPAPGPAERGRRTPLDEDDDNFFRSLAPMLRALRTEQKLQFRSRVLALALRVQAERAHYVELQPPDSHYRGELDPDALDEDALETKYRPPPAPDTAHTTS